VINLGSAELSVSAVFTATGKYLAPSTTVAAGKVAYLFANESSLNSAVQDTLSNIENVTLSGNGANYVIGSSSANSITGGTGADTIDGGAGNDTITGGEGADSLTGGAGADTFVFAAGATGTPSATNFDTITDYVSGTDIIAATAITKFATAVTAASGTAGVAATTGVVRFDAADNTDALRLAAVANALSTAASGNTLIYTNGTDSFVFISDGTAGVGANDVLIKLAGIAGAGADELTVSSNTITALS
jgi:Ca2+-binding RTX toxin-like protein